MKDRSWNLLQKNVWGLSSASYQRVTLRLLEESFNMPPGIPNYNSAMVSMMLLPCILKKIVKEALCCEALTIKRICKFAPNLHGKPKIKS
jgi:hypothetical protein